MAEVYEPSREALFFKLGYALSTLLRIKKEVMGLPLEASLQLDEAIKICDPHRPVSFGEIAQSGSAQGS